LKHIVCILVSLSFYYSQARFNKWSSHYAYNQVQSIEVSEKKVFAVSNGNLFIYNKRDKSFFPYSKIQGLSDSDISEIFYSENTKKLVIIYSNFNIDILDEELNVVNVPDIYLKTTINNKHLNSISESKNNSAVLLLTNFGVVELNLLKFEIAETYFLYQDIIANDMIQTAESYILAAENGVYRTNFTNIDIANIFSWDKLNHNLVNHKNLEEIEIYNEDIYLKINDSLFKTKDLLHFDTIHAFCNKGLKFIKSINGGLYVATSEELVDLNNPSNKIKSEQTNDFDFNSDSYWLASESQGLRSVKEGSFVEFKLSSLESSDVFKMKVNVNGDLYVCPFSYKSDWTTDSSKAVIYKLHNNSWSSINFPNAYNTSDIVFNPVNASHLFVSSWYGKNNVFELKDNQIVNSYNVLNSTVQSSLGNVDQKSVRISSLGFQQNGKLWVVNSDVENILSSFYQDNWNAHKYYSNQKKSTSDLLINMYNHVWINISEKDGLQPQFLLYNIQDDVYKALNLIDNDGNSYNKKVLDFAEDQNAQIWVAFEGGVLVYPNPFKAFDEDIEASKLYRNGESKFLLEGKTVTSVAVDGANRKWFGTENNGVYLIGESGLNLIQHFEKENSPLPSNKIVDIAIDHNSGRVYFGTDRGIVSYISDATKGKESLSSVLIYPNPVKEDYSGNVYIKNLMDNSIVKITSLSGDLVYEAFSVGGTLVWDLNSFDGVRPVPGIYLVYCTSKDGEKSEVLKIAIL
jgi:hypothetical protein